MHSTYTWMGSPIHVVLDDEIADAFNRAQAAFFAAQLDYKERTGSEWTGHEVLEMNWTPEEQRVWNAFGSVINALVDLNGGSIPITVEDCPSDYLEKV